jgi:hypothetical protein
MEDVTTLLSLTTGVFPIACKTESRIGLLCAMIFSPRPAAAYASGIGCSKIRLGTRSEDLRQLLRRLQEPVKGTEYFLPLGAE